LPSDDDWLRSKSNGGLESPPFDTNITLGARAGPEQTLPGLEDYFLAFFFVLAFFAFFAFFAFLAIVSSQG
jgi:hypothetical protein